MERMQEGDACICGQSIFCHGHCNDEYDTFESRRQDTLIKPRDSAHVRSVPELPMIEYTPAPIDMLTDNGPELDHLLYEDTVNLRDLESPFGNLAGIL